MMDKRTFGKGAHSELQKWKISETAIPFTAGPIVIHSGCVIKGPIGMGKKLRFLRGIRPMLEPNANQLSDQRCPCRRRP
jgi:hypothetical protein